MNTKTDENGDIFFHIQTQGYPEEHGHAGFNEFIFVTSGEILHKFNGTEKIESAGKLLYLKSSDRHSLIMLNENSEYIMLKISERHLSAYFVWVSPQIEEKLASAPSEITLSAEKTKELTSLAYKVLTSKSQTQYELAHLLTQAFFKETLLAAEENETYYGKHKAVVSFKRITDDPKSLALTLDELIEKTGYSYPHLNRLFLAEENVSVGKYFQRQRMNYAKTLLTYTDKTLTEIAEAIGFSAYPHFSSFFKANERVTPSAYRAKKDKKNEMV